MLYRRVKTRLLVLVLLLVILVPNVVNGRESRGLGGGQGTVGRPVLLGVQDALPPEKRGRHWSSMQ